MTKGIRAYFKKQKRSVRRQNHIARDLRTPKFKMRRVELDKPAVKNWKLEDEYCRNGRPDEVDDLSSVD